MRNLLPNKEEHYKVFADAMEQLYRSSRLGIAPRKRRTSLEVARLRKEIVNWQDNEDAGALTNASFNYRTWLPVTYEFNTSMGQCATGYYQSPTPVGPVNGISVQYPLPGGTTQNIIDVNAGGCITRINLNPTININSSTSYIHNQSVASTVWDIQHNMGLTPSVFMEDTNGDDISGVIEIVDSNRIKVFFNQPVAGKAYLS